MDDLYLSWPLVVETQDAWTTYHFQWESTTFPLARLGVEVRCWHCYHNVAAVASAGGNGRENIRNTFKTVGLCGRFKHQLPKKEKLILNHWILSSSPYFKWWDSCQNAKDSAGYLEFFHLGCSRSTLAPLWLGQSQALGPWIVGWLIGFARWWQS